MESNKLSRSGIEFAKEFLDKFGFKSKLEEIINDRDDNIIPILSSNIAIFGVSVAIFFSTKKEEILTAPIILIFISSILALFSFLLNLWYLSRIKTRTSFFKEEQEKIYIKSENLLIKIFDLFKKIVKLNKPLENVTEENLSNIVKQQEFDLKFLAEDGVFIPMMILDLASKETLLSFNKCYDSPLNEKYAGFKLFVDRLSDRAKNWGLVLGSAFMLAAILIKFIAVN